MSDVSVTAGASATQVATLDPQQPIDQMTGETLAAIVIDPMVINMQNTPGASLRNIKLLQEIAKRLRG